ncbi:MAG: hypothetical protein ACRDKU_05300, partial [Gaiellaceae bacterium]
MNDAGNGRLRARTLYAYAVKEGAHGGTRGGKWPFSVETPLCVGSGGRNRKQEVLDALSVDCELWRPSDDEVLDRLYRQSPP